MLKSIVWFALGIIATVVVVLRWYLPAAGEDKLRSNEAAATANSEPEVEAPVRQSDSPATDSTGTQSSSPNRSVTRVNVLPAGATDPSSWELPVEFLRGRDAHYLALAAATGRTVEDIQRLTQRNFDFKSEFQDRHERFASEASESSENLAGLEGVVSSQAWVVAGIPYPPASLATECRSSGCRVILTYTTGEEAGAVFRSLVDLRLLATLEMHDFEAAEAILPSYSPESEPIDPGFEVFLWRRANRP